MFCGMFCTTGTIGTCWTRCGQVGCGVGHTVVARLTALTDLLVGEVIVGSCGTSNGICGSKRAIVGLRASSPKSCVVVIWGCCVDSTLTIVPLGTLGGHVGQSRDITVVPSIALLTLRLRHQELCRVVGTSWTQRVVKASVSNTVFAHWAGVRSVFVDTVISRRARVTQTSLGVVHVCSIFTGYGYRCALGAVISCRTHPSRHSISGLTHIGSTVTVEASITVTCIVGLPDSVTVFAQGTIDTMGQHGLPSAGEVGTNRAGDRGSCALRTVVPCCTVVPVGLTNRVLLCGSQQAVVTSQTFTSR